MAVEIRPAAPADWDTLTELLRQHLAELASFDPGEPRPPESYPYLDHYRSDPHRTALLVLVEGQVAGFVLVRALESTAPVTRQVAEFYVAPDHRRQGTGTAAVTAVWRRWPGLWELDVLAANAAAVAFWTRCIDAQAWSWRLEAGEGGQRLTFRFTIRRSTA